MYNWIPLCSKTSTEIYGRYLVNAIKTTHAVMVDSCAYMITDKRDDSSIFYSGDLNRIPGVDYSKFDNLYFEATANPAFIMHLNIDTLDKVMSTFKDKISIMHYEQDDIDVITEAGFKIVENVWEKGGFYEFNN
jgi:hypothetical protein